MIQDSGDGKITIKETELLARNLIASIGKDRRIFALVGDLGAGKTTFSRFFLHVLGIKESVTSPTFVIFKKYSIPESRILNPESFAFAYHMDCYRLKNTEELAPLGFAEIIADEKNIILIEWADHIHEVLPSETIWIDFTHAGEIERIISVRHK